MSRQIGLMEWFRPGEYQRVENFLEAAKPLGVKDLRTGICWADWYTSEGDGWYAWLLPRLATQFSLLPCFLYTPPSLGIAPKFSSPPRSPEAYADFIDVMITRFGEYFDYLELWNQPDNVNNWDTRMDPDWTIFREMIGGAAYWIRKRQKKVVLPGLWPTNARWFEMMSKGGVLPLVDAVGVHAFPSRPEFEWRGWQQEIGDVRQQLTALGAHPEIWVTQTGFSTWRGDEESQVSAFADAVSAPCERIYWSELIDKSTSFLSSDASQSDERDYHYGLLRADGSPKLLYRKLAGDGLKSTVESARFVRKGHSTPKPKRALITGGAGFIGTNLAERLAKEGCHVTVYDNLSRPGVEQNVEWLRQHHPEHVAFNLGDVRDGARLWDAVSRADQVFHFAAQVAVTTSLANPREDYEVNLGGTINLLEAIRSSKNAPSLIFTSTNKVYGGLSDLSLEQNCSRYQPLDKALRSGIGEDRPLDFHSPYGCSKGAADQYVLDYARSFNIPAVVFRMSCIYGPHQMGTEDQGWVAHFLLRAADDEPVMICGDGMQVRDILFVDDLVDALQLAQANSQTLSGQAFNIGGGLGNTISLIELLQLIEEINGKRPEINFSPWRTGDQKYYVSDTSKFKAATGWAARVTVRDGVKRLTQWLRSSRGPSHATTAAVGGEHALLAR